VQSSLPFGRWSLVDATHFPIFFSAISMALSCNHLFLTVSSSVVFKADCREEENIKLSQSNRSGKDPLEKSGHGRTPLRLT